MGNTTGKKYGGREKGTPNKSTAEAKELLNSVLSKELNKLGLLLGKLEPLERVNVIAKLLPYIVPKQVQQDITITPPEMTDEQIEARIEYLKNKLIE